MRTVVAGFMFVMLAGVAAPASPKPAAPATACDEVCRRMAAMVDPIITDEMASQGIPGAAFIFVQGDRVVFEKGYGVSDVRRQTAVSPKSTVWPIASVTKIVTALGAMQLVDTGKVRLDGDLNDYLKRIKIPAQGFGPLTLRQLLSQTSGLDELPGRQFDGQSVPDLAEFLKTRLVRYRASGQLTAYSSYGLALAGLLVEDVSGLSYAEYLRRHIFEPAGMTSARVMRMIGDERGVATPYVIKDRKAVPVPYEWYVTEPSSSVAATVDDMAKLLIADLNGGAVAGRSLLSGALMQAMVTQQATNHPDLPGWGLGFQMDRVNGLTVAEHGGDIGGFSSLFVLIPEKRAGFYIVNHGEGSDLRFKVKQALLDGLYPDPHPQLAPRADPSKVDALKEYAGRYLSTLSCRSCSELGDVFEVTVEPDAILALWGQNWVPL
jgi:CubicO group peptidase (beta-lactamase class C family)